MRRAAEAESASKSGPCLCAALGGLPSRASSLRGWGSRRVGSRWISSDLVGSRRLSAHLGASHRRPSVANAQSRLVASCALKASGVAAAKVASSSSNAGCGA